MYKSKKLNKTFVLLLLLSAITACGIKSFNMEPDKTGEKYSLVRFKVKTFIDNRKNKLKILLSYDSKGDRLLFFGPMNQVLFEIHISGNYSKIIVPKRKKFWTGEFRMFLIKLWNIDLSYNEIKDLLLHGRVNAKKLRKNGFFMQIFDSENKKRPVVIKLTGEKISLEFKVSGITTRNGKINLSRNLSGYKKVSLEQLFNKNKN